MEPKLHSRLDAGSDPFTAPSFSSSALITIDVQQDTLDGQPLEIPGTSAALPKIRRLLDAFRENGKPIIHVVRIYKRDGSNVDLCRRKRVSEGHGILSPDSEGVQPAAPLFPGHGPRLDSERLLQGGFQEITPTEALMYKPRWGAFYGTGLENHLRERGIDTLIFTGCNFPNCPRTSIYEASERDFRIVLVTDAVSGIYDQGKSEMANIGVSLLDSDSVLACMRAGSPN